MSTYVFLNTGDSVFPSIIGSVSSCTVPSNLLTLSSNYGLPISFTDPKGACFNITLCTEKCLKRCQRGNQTPRIEGQIIQWPEEILQNYKQSTNTAQKTKD